MLRFLLSIFFLFFASSSLFCDETIDNNASNNQDMNTFFDDTIEYIEDKRVGFGQSLVVVTNNIDSFFTDEDIDFKKKNRSYAKVEFSVLQEEGKGIFFDTNIKLKADLPNTNERLKFSLDNEEEDSTNHREKELGKTVKGEDFTSSLGYIHKNTEFTNFKTGVGTKITADIEPFLYSDIKFNFYHEEYKLTLGERVTLFSKKPDTFLSSADFNVPINDVLTFSFYNSAQYEYRRPYFNFTSSVGLYQFLNKREGLFYSISAFGDNKKRFQTNSYVYSLLHRNRFKSGYYFDLLPQIHLQRENGFREYYSITLRIGIEFFD